MSGREPTLIDSHAHAWDATALIYPWLALAPQLPRTADAARLADEIGADGYIFVEAGADRGFGVKEAVRASRSDWPGLRGVVAAVDLLAADLEATLSALRLLPLVVGVRHNLQGEAAGALVDSRWRRGLEIVAAHGLTFDACVRRGQLGELAAMVGAVPNLDVALDHMGGPPVSEGLASQEGREWVDRIRRLAELPSVHVKLSGLPAIAADGASLRAHGPELVRAAVDSFGADRSMIGSDWPVSTTLGAGASFADWKALVRSALTSDEWRHVAGKTVKRFYLRRS